MRFDDIRTVECPAFAESISEGDLRWEKAEGDAVAQDEVICEVETDKTSVPVPSPVAGVVQKLLVEDGATVNPGMKLAEIKVGEGAVAKPAAAEKKEAPTVPDQQPSPPPPPPPPPPPTQGRRTQRLTSLRLKE